MRLQLSDTIGCWASAATEYLHRGGYGGIEVTQQQADVTVTDSASRGNSEWRFTDAAGDPVNHSQWIVHAVAHREPVQLQLRSGDQILAAGVTDVRRSIVSTVAVALSSAGPLIEMALSDSTAPRPAGDRRPSDPPNARTAALRANTALAGRVVRAAMTYRQWGVARLPARTLDHLIERRQLSGRLEWHSPPPSFFWADPTVVSHDGQCWLFLEELDRKTGRGHIRALRWLDGILQRGPVVYTTPHHLSYPQVQFVGGRWLATVETCAAANPILTFDSLGDPWRVCSDLSALPPHMADPVVVFRSDGTPDRLISTDAMTGPDTNYVEHIYEEDRWVRDPCATYVDITSARGGGTRDPLRGVRAVQDCAGGYGLRLGVVPDTDWSGTVYGEPLTRLDPDDVPLSDWQPAGVHTLTWTPDQEQVWIDGWRRQPSAVGGYRRIVERRHLRQCEG